VNFKLKLPDGNARTYYGTTPTPELIKMAKKEEERTKKYITCKMCECTQDNHTYHNFNDDYCDACWGTIVDGAKARNLPICDMIILYKYILSHPETRWPPSGSAEQTKILLTALNESTHK